MSVILDTKINPEIEAADSRFFVVDSSREIVNDVDFFLFSQSFLIRNGDLLNFGSANLVLQADMDESCQLVETGYGHHTLTIGFQDQMRSNAEIRWGLTVTKPGYGREETRIASSAIGSRAFTLNYDNQGVMRERADVSPDHAALLIMDLVNSDYFKSITSNKRTALEKAQADISQFSVEAIGKYSAQKYKKLLENKERVIEKIGFSSTQHIQM